MPLSHREKAFNGQCIRENHFQQWAMLQIWQLSLLLWSARQCNIQTIHYQSNSRTEMAIAAVSQILKSTSDIDITKALTTYFDTPVSNILSSPAKLFYCKQINNRLSVWMTPTPLTDQQKSQLSEKCLTHLKPMKRTITSACQTNPSGSL